MEAPTLRTELCASYSQIVEGRVLCAYCTALATVTLATGADPEDEPMCWYHARTMLDNSLALGDSLFAAQAVA